MRYSVILEACGTGPMSDCAESQADSLTEELGMEVHVAYSDGCEPSVEEALQEVASEDPDVLLVVPFHSAFSQTVEDGILEDFGVNPKTRRGIMKLSGKDVEVRVAEFEVGSDSEVTGIIAKAVRDAMRQYCQSCGMPLDDSVVSREPDGSVNWKYCKWCYSDGRFAYSSIEEISAFLSPFMAKEGFSPEQVKDFLETTLPSLERWRSS